MADVSDFHRDQSFDVRMAGSSISYVQKVMADSEKQGKYPRRNKTPEENPNFQIRIVGRFLHELLEGP